MLRTMLVGLALALAVLGAPQAAPQKATFDDLLQSSKAPAVLLPKNLPPDAVAYAIHMKGESLDLGNLAMMGAGGSSEQTVLTQLLALRSLYWTRGDHMLLDGVDYLVAYRSELGIADLLAMRSEKELKKPLTLGLVLLRNSEIVSIMPRPDVKQSQLVDLASRVSDLLGGAHEKAKQTATLSNSKQIALAVLMYLGDNHDVMPYVQDTNTLTNLTYPYAKNADVWQTMNPKGGRFLLNMSLSGVDITDVEDPTGTPMVYESESWEDGRRVVAYVDGHAKLVTPDEWTKLQPKLKLNLKRHGKPLPPTPTLRTPQEK